MRQTSSDPSGMSEQASLTVTSLAMRAWSSDRPAIASPVSSRVGSSAGCPPTWKSSTILETSAFASGARPAAPMTSGEETSAATVGASADDTCVESVLG